MSYVSQLNILHQAGKIEKPVWTFTLEKMEEQGDDLLVWTCYLKVGEFETNGYFKNKQYAKEKAAYNYFKYCCPEEDRERILGSLRKQAFKNCLQEMNVAPQTEERTASPMMLQKDLGVVVDGGLFTNTDAFTATKIINNNAIALDNPAGSGAPYSKHTAVYKIYQRWEEKNTNISPALSSGTEIFRLSLDPATWPKRIRDYVMFHDSILPSLDIVVAIGGAAGTIGWITMGWVRDASNDKTYTLDDLQQVNAETNNLNGTQIFKIHLTDVRKTGLYRKTIGDPEPYPGVIFMIDQAVTNVQRNDSVNYPVRVQARLAQDCLLMEPFGQGGGDSPSDTSFDLGSYMLTNELDILVGSSATTNDLSETKSFTDAGFKRSTFIPVWEKNFILSSSDEITEEVKLAFTDEETPSSEFLTQLEDFVNKGTAVDVKGGIHTKILIGFGQVQTPKTFAELKGTVYTIPKQIIKYRAMTYTCNKLYVQNQGCILLLELSYVLGNGFLIFTSSNKDIKPKDFNFDYAESSETSVSYFYKDSTHNNDIVGDDGNLLIPSDNLPILLTDGYITFKEISTYVQTGNSLPSSNLPAGLKQLTFIRQGTTSTESKDNPFAVIDNPIIGNVTLGLSNLMRSKGWDAISGDLYVDGLNIGNVGYQNGIFFVRTDEYKKVKAGVSNDIYIKKIVELTNVQGLSQFNTNGMLDWNTSSTRSRVRRVNLENCVRESAIIGGSVLQGLGQGISGWSQQLFQKDMLEKVLRNQRGITDANNLALAQRAKDAFERNLELKGYSSASMQHGQAGPRNIEEMSTKPLIKFESAGPLSPKSGNSAKGRDEDGSVSIDLSKQQVVYTRPRTVNTDQKVLQGTEIPAHATKISIDGSESISTLNPNASSFVPASAKSALNANAATFVPGQTGHLLAEHNFGTIVNEKPKV